MAHPIEYQTIDLRGRITSGASLEFLKVEVPVGAFRAPFAVVGYALNGEEQSLGLRLDLDKRVFLDHFEDDYAKEVILRHAAPEIVTAVYEDMFAREQGRTAVAAADKGRFYAQGSMPEWAGMDQYIGRRRETSTIMMCYSDPDSRWPHIFKEHIEHNLRPGQQSEFQWLEASGLAHGNYPLRNLWAAPSVILVFLSRDLADSDAVRSNKLHMILNSAQRMGTIVLSIVLDPIPGHELDWLAEFYSVNDSSRALTRIDRPQIVKILDKVTKIVEESLKR